jgi:hypothetical protein
VRLSLADFAEHLEVAQVALVGQPLVVFLHLEIMDALANTYRRDYFCFDGNGQRGGVALGWILCNMDYFKHRKGSLVAHQFYHYLRVLPIADQHLIVELSQKPAL